MITIDEIEFRAILMAHKDVLDVMDASEYQAGYLAAISDALTALKVAERKPPATQI